MKKNKWLTKGLNAICVLALTQCFFFIIYEAYTKQKIQRELTHHAEVVSVSLWHVDKSTVIPYISQLANTHTYRSITITDNTGALFTSTDKRARATTINSWPNLTHQAPIYYDNKIIGYLVASISPRLSLISNFLFFLFQILFAIIFILGRKNRTSKQQLINLAKALESRNKQLEKTIGLEIQRNEVKTEFFAKVSHEFRTPLNSIIGITDILPSCSKEEQEQYINALNHTSKSLLALINDILDFSKLESGNLDLNYEDFDLSSLIHNITLPLSITQEDIPLHLNIQPDIPDLVHSDPIRLQQILINLLGNAFKFTTAGFVSLKVVLDNNYLIFSIIDTGRGISEDDQKRIFLPYKQASSNGNEKLPGTGLGLSICVQILDLMEGDIKVESKHSEGTCFTFRIPYIAARKETQKASASPSNHVSFDIKALIVEDNAVSRMVLSKQLDDLGLNYTTADNGRSAFEAIQNHSKDPFDLVFMDYNMPEMDGLATSKAIRNWEQTQNKQPVRICALTGQTYGDIASRLSEAGVNDFLTKPIDYDTLKKYLQDNFTVN